mgnify:CR=1 FL=1
MKHRALSMLLALLMVVSLLPIAAVAGNEEANFTMRLQGGTYNASYSLFADTYEGVRFDAYDESKNVTRSLSGNDTLTYDGKVVTSVVYDSNNDSDNTWRVTIAEPESGEQSGWIEYSGKRISIDLRLKHGEKVESFVGKTADEKLATPFEWNGQTYYLGVSDGEDVRPFGSGSCELQNENSRNGFMFKAQVFTLNDEDNYVRVSDDVRAWIDKDYNIFVKVWPTESCVGYYRPHVETLQDGSLNCQFTTASLGTWLIEVTAIPREGKSGFTHYSQLTVSYRETQANGVLGMSYDGSGFVKSYELFAGIHRNIEFKVGNEPLNFSAIREDAPANEKLTYGGLINKLGYMGEGCWTIELAEPQGEQTTGWIQYGADGSNRVTITVKPSHGGAVDKDAPETKIYEQGSVEFIEAERGVVTPFKWHDETYYLGIAAWSTKKPYALGGRGVNEAEDFYAACVFSLKSGEAGSSDVTYELREDIRKEMMDENFTFQLTLVPTSIGCDYYPITRTVDMTLEQQGDGSTVAFTSKWQGQKFSKASVGLWVYDACIFYSNGELFKENLSSCKYSYTVNDTVELEGSIEEINETIAAVLHEKDAELGNTEMEKNGLYNGEVTFILPKGTLAGEIVIPDTNCIVTVYGNDYGRGRIATTLEGGVRFDNDNTNHVGFIHFVGKGKDGNGNYVKWADERNQIPNEAVYGVGQGAPEVCIFEGYDIAIHSTKRPSWGSQDSIYLNNNVAICQNSNNGGQTIMRNNWFIGNNIAVMLKESVLVDYLMNFRNRFINNTIDFDNESYKVLWVSENFFYHGSWNPTEADLRRVENGEICPIFNEEGQLIVPSAPSYTKTANYKDDYNAYKAFLPRFGGFSQTYAYPIATSQFCNEMFYPNRRDPSYCPQWWSKNDPYYPSYVQQGVTISENELDGLRLSSYDSAKDTAVGTFDFGSSSTETEH